jgi:hypothetical protein
MLTIIWHNYRWTDMDKPGAETSNLHSGFLVFEHVDKIDASFILSIINIIIGRKIMSAKSFYTPVIAAVSFLSVLGGCKEKRDHSPTILPLHSVVDTNEVVLTMTQEAATITVDSIALDSNKALLSIDGTISKTQNENYNDLINEKVKLVFSLRDTAGKMIADPDNKFNIGTEYLKNRGLLEVSYMDPNTRAYFISTIDAGKKGFPKGFQEMLDRNRPDSTSKMNNPIRTVSYKGPIY